MYLFQPNTFTKTVTFDLFSGGHHHHHHPYSVFHGSLAGSQKSTGFTDQTPLAKNFQNICYVLRITDFCIRIYRAGRGKAVLNCRVLCLGHYPLWVALMVLYRPFPVAIFFQV